MLDIQYVDNAIHIRSRDSDGNRIEKIDDTWHPYFFIPHDAVFYDTRGYANIDDSRLYKTIDGDIVKKVLFINDNVRRGYSKKFKNQSWEADVKPEQRYLLDKYKSIPDVKPKLLALDIETDSQYAFPTAESAQYPITCITVLDSFERICKTFVWREDQKPRVENKYGSEIHYYDNEYMMIGDFIEYVEKVDPDIITGWNVDAYDMQYIVNRCARLGIDYRDMSPYHEMEYSYKFGRTIIKGRHVIDGLEIYKKLIFWRGSREAMKESNSLDAVAERHMGQHKKKMKHSITTVWLEDLEELIEYNIIDVVLVLDLIEELKLFDILDELRHLCNSTWEVINHNSLLLDYYCLRYAHDVLDVILPSKRYDRERENYPGAHVFDPPEGIFPNIGVFDIKSMYPNIMIQFNLSPETVCEKGKGKYKIDDVGFKKKKGFAVHIIEELTNQRVKYKELVAKIKENDNYDESEYFRYEFRQINYKVLINSFYGAMAYPSFRLYNKDVPKSVTWTGREMLMWTKEVIEKHGFKVIYGDTDSVFVSFGEGDMCDKLVECFKLLDVINKSYDEFAKKLGADGNNRMEIEFEKLYETCIFVGVKKRYIGRTSWKGHPKVTMDSTGFESRRNDTPLWAHGKLIEFYNKLLDREKKEDVETFIRDCMEDIKVQLPDDIGISIKLGRSLDEYVKSNPMHVRGAKYMRDNFGYQFAKGDYLKILFVTKVPEGKPETDVICLTENSVMPEGFDIDTKRTYERLIVKKTEDLLPLVGIDPDVLFERKKKKRRKKKTE